MPCILIIEDDAPMRALLAEWLTAQGYCVRTVIDDHAAMHETADLVIIDVYMPRHVAADRVRALRVAHPGVPIVAISGQFRAGVRCEGSAAGALGVDRVIAKPFGWEALLEVVRSLIGPQALASR